MEGDQQRKGTSKGKRVARMGDQQGKESDKDWGLAREGEWQGWGTRKGRSVEWWRISTGRG